MRNVKYGERSQVVKAVDCGSAIRGFESHRSPFNLLISFRQLRAIALIFSFLLILLLTSCQINLFIPDQQLIGRAIARQIQLTSSNLQENLLMQGKVNQAFIIDRLLIENIETSDIMGGRSYHVTGAYHLQSDPPSQTKIRADHPFDIYIQRQIEGKTWRLLRPVFDQEGKQINWLSYLID